LAKVGKKAVRNWLKAGQQAIRTLWQAWLFDWAIEGVTSAHTMLRSADELVAISSEQGFPLAVAAGKFVRGWSLGAVGQAAEGIPLMLQGIAVTRTMDTKMLAPFILMALAEIYGMHGRHEEGLNQLAEASKVIETTHERWSEDEMHRRRGTLLLSLNDQAAAEDSFRQALTVARHQSAKFSALRAALNLARLWRDQGKRVEAHDFLAPIYEWFTEGFDTPVLKDARALLDELA
jgi:predicted ATPase